MDDRRQDLSLGQPGVMAFMTVAQTNDVTSMTRERKYTFDIEASASSTYEWLEPTTTCSVRHEAGLKQIRTNDCS